MVRWLQAVVLIAVTQAATAVFGGDAYYNIPVRDLKLVEGSLPDRQESLQWRLQSRLEMMQPYAVLDGQGEAYVAGRGDPRYRRIVVEPMPAGVQDPDAAVGAGTRVLIRAPEGKEITGRLFVPKSDVSGMISLRFTVPASAARPEAKESFYWGKIAYYQPLLNREIPGGAWFRHQVRLARMELKLKPEDERARTAPWRGRLDDPTRTYDLFTGGRAMSENLQLDRELPPLRANEKPVKVDSINGITIQEIDWKPLVKDGKPKLDPLAHKIPADQHAIFFPSFQAAVAASDEAKLHDTPVLRLAQARAENNRVIERYQEQLGIPMSTLARLLGPTLAKSVALTGSDPFFPMGTDVAVLLEAPQPAILENALLGRIALAAAQNKDVKQIKGEIGGLEYRGFRSPDRRVSSYVAKLDGAVVVTNSTYQLGRLAAVRKGEVKPIASLPEYTFFRIRYPLGDADETALAFLSDPTIRRWCGPRWRIADSRRTRAAAVMAELQASQLDGLVKRTVKPGPIHTDLPVLGGGELTLASSGVQSSTYGTLDFMTPIAELPLEEVTQAEADAYGQWRDGYQRNWSWAFDPVALRISLGKDKLASDMTVMPLIASTEYREFLSLTQGGEFRPTAGDPHDALAHLILAVNRESPRFRDLQGFVTGMGRTASLGWVGQSISVYVEDDPFWNDLAQVKEDKIGEFMEKNIGRVPVAARIEASNPLMLAAFLTSFRSYVEQTAMGLTIWEPMKYKDQPYLRITPGKESRGFLRPPENLAIYYTTVDNALTITLSEKVLQRTIDRSLERNKALAEGKPAEEGVKPWLGSNVGLRVDRRILDVANALSRAEYEQRMQAQCWGNLPILNQWKRLYPDRDPVAVHKGVWDAELVCPGGGKYVWNDKYQTMESTVYGHPGEPKQGPPAPPVLSTFTTGDFGLTFENQGLRARVLLEREAAKKSAP